MAGLRAFLSNFTRRSIEADQRSEFRHESLYVCGGWPSDASRNTIQTTWRFANPVAARLARRIRERRSRSAGRRSRARGPWKLGASWITT